MGVKLLPREQKKIIETVLSVVIEALENERVIVLREPCNCGHHIRHNNGGNYHEIIRITRDGEEYFGKFYNTCELVEVPDWEVMNKEDAYEIIETTLKEGWDYEIND